MKVLRTIALCLSILCACTDHKSSRNESLVATLTSASDAQQNRTTVVYISRDGGRRWMPYDNGIPQEVTVSAFLVLDNHIFASTDYHGVYLVREGEKEWRRIDDDLPKDVDINAMVAGRKTLIIGTRNHGIFISGNGGRNWSRPSAGILRTSVRSLHKKDDMLFAGADNGIYRSVDDGNTWEYVYKGVQVNGFTELNNTLYAALMNGAIMMDDKSSRWKYVYELHTLHDISSDGKNLYAMTLGDGLKKSGDNGLTWENINNGLGTLNLYTFEVKTFGNRIFAAQWYGIYASDDGGANWSIIKDGLPDSTAFTTLETTRNGLIAGIGLR